MKVGLLFKKISNHLEAVNNESLRCYGLTSAQLDLMVLLDDRGEAITSQKDIGQYFGIKHTTTIHILKRLEEKQLVYREINGENAKYRNVHLTEEGKQKVAVVKEKRENFDRLIFGQMSKHDRAELHRLLSEVYQNLQGAT